MRPDEHHAGGEVSYTLALGPFHSAWRGPQRFVLKLNGEQIADVEYQSGFNERGCAERLPRLDLPQALHLVNRICSDCSIAHSLAFCQAVEQLCNLAIPESATYLRSIAAEIERLASHLRAAAGVLEAIGAEPRAAAINALRESTLQMMQSLSGSRIIPDLCVPGGVRRRPAQRERESILIELPRLNRLLYRFIDQLIDDRGILARTVEVGVLQRNAAEQFGVRGPLGRASGIPRDTRIDQPYAAYPQLSVRPITQESGDVYARLVTLLLEAYESVKLIEQAMHALPDGEHQGQQPESLKSGQASSAVESPHGMIRYSIESDGRRITAAHIDTPRQIDRLLARTLLSGALLDNVIAIVASVDPCIACAEQ